MTKLYHLIAAAVIGATATSGLQAQKLTLDPASGAVVKYIETVDFTYDAMVDAVDLQKVYVTDDVTGARTYCSSFAALTDWTNYMKGGTLTFPRISAEGSYTLTMEPGAVKPWFDSDPSNELVTARYTVDPAAGETTVFSYYNLTPAAGATVARLEKVQVQFTKIGWYDTVVVDQAKAKEITLVCGGKTYYGFDLAGAYGTYTFSFAETQEATESVPVTAPGEYRLTIPAGLFNDGAENPDELKANAEITADYVVSEDIDFRYSADPASGSVLSIASLTNLKVNFQFGSEVNSVSLDPAVAGAAFSVTLNGAPLAKVDNVNSEEGYAVEKFGTTVTVSISKSLITEPSEVHITAPKGAFTVDGLASPAIDYAVTYNPPKEFTFEITPTPNVAVAPFDEVTILFTNATTIEKYYYTSDRAGKLTSVRPGSTPIYSTSVTLVEDLDGHPAVKVGFASAPADDNYVFSFPKNEVKLDGEGNPLVECIFRVDSAVGIEESAADGLRVLSLPGELQILNPAGEEVTVHTLDGKRLCRLTDRAVSLRVAPGCYVVNTGNQSLKLVVK